MQPRGDAGEWEALLTDDGSWTALHPVHGEACHSRAGAWTEAVERYAAPCRLTERARSLQAIRLLDVGTGLGWNLAAALRAVAGQRAALSIVSLEWDFAVLRTALALRERNVRSGAPWQPEYAQVLSALAAVVSDPTRAGSDGVPLGERHHLRVLSGDARITLPELGPEELFEAVFLDPFSPARDEDLWEEDFAREVARRMSPGSWLSTYSAAFGVRRALVRAGLRVGVGPRVGAKREGTLASPDLDPPPLPERLERRLGRELDVHA